MNTLVLIKPVEREDITSIISLLSNASLPVSDLPENLPHFFNAEISEEIIGVIGLEIYSQFALIRSFVVAEANRNAGIGNMLYDTIINYISQKHISEVYLLTTTASKYFESKGFNVVDRELVPLEIQSSQQFQSSCPASALVLKKLIIT